MSVYLFLLFLRYFMIGLCKTSSSVSCKLFCRYFPVNFVKCSFTRSSDFDNTVNVVCKTLWGYEEIRFNDHESCKSRDVHFSKFYVTSSWSHDKRVMWLWSQFHAKFGVHRSSASLVIDLTSPSYKMSCECMGGSFSSP